MAALLSVPTAAQAQSAPASAIDPAVQARIDRVLAKTPLIDGHNDWAWALHENYDTGAATLDLKADTRWLEKPLDTDIPRLRQGRVGGQFWSVWIPAEIPGADAVTETLAQIDRVRTIVARYPGTFELAGTAADVRRIHKAGKIASMMGVEGGNQIDNSLAVLRMYYALGARYLTLTHAKTTDWADSANDTALHDGLTAFGRAVVHELNRLGMMVDLSHVSVATMRDALEATVSPVIFSHSGAFAVNPHVRNVPDDILRRVKANGGVVMVTFVAGYVSDAHRHWAAERAAEFTRLSGMPYDGLYVGRPELAEKALAEWDAAHPRPSASIAEVADHIEHVRDVAGIDHVGLGSDYDGTTYLPEGLDGTETYPALFAELIRRGWSDADLAKLAGGNLLRAMEANEAVAKALAGETVGLTKGPGAGKEWKAH
ncbi:dipeptidase [Novosphingobium sp. BW1]|uniref:dipeptidase n=1 Tax=Novosphingobium sp. BW1 TaxID=2592621 RepID=UPI001F081D0E|nr:dipeptidase [Novosphingobium sp. BW1]